MLLQTTSLQPRFCTCALITSGFFSRQRHANLLNMELVFFYVR